MQKLKNIENLSENSMWKNYVTYKNNHQFRKITYLNKLQAVLNAPAQKKNNALKDSF